MKKKIVFLLLLIIFPINIYAYELSCDEGVYTYGNSFSCKILGEKKPYNRLAGTISSDNTISCEMTNSAIGFNPLPESTTTSFNLTGTPTSEELISLTCNVVEKTTSITNARVTINAFTYDIGLGEQTELLSSDYIKLGVYEDTGPKDTKPRNTSNPDTRLKTLSEDNLSFTYSQFITNYNIEVLYEVESLNLKYSLINPESKARILLNNQPIEGNIPLSVGVNVIDVYVSNPTGTEETCYTLNVTRLARGEEIYYPEKDSSLESMTVSGFAINFDKKIFDYKVHLERNTSSIIVNAKATHSGATISISNTDNLINGSVVTVKVTSQDESSTTTYKINITKEPPKKDYSSIIILGVLALALIVTLTIFIVTSQKRKKNDPILNLKNSKRKINKGKKFDGSAVPETLEETGTIISSTNNEQNISTPENLNNINIPNQNSPLSQENIENNQQNIVTNSPTISDSNIQNNVTQENSNSNPNQ